MKNVKLFLHIGTEKTGSSFLQTVLYHNRKWLQTHSVFFPDAGKWEKELKANRISPGNGEALQERLIHADWKGVRKLLDGYLMHANDASCSKIIVSNELLFEALASQGVFTSFRQLCIDMNIDLEPALLFIREPIDQALSLYKHRSNNGTTPEINDWLRTSYNLPETLYKLINNLDNNRNWILLKKYQKDSGYLVQTFFQEWIGIPVSPVWDNQLVNPSLTLSELLIISLYRKHFNPKWTSSFYQKMLQIPKLEKSLDKGLEGYYRGQIAQYQKEHAELWNKIDELIIDGNLTVEAASEMTDQIGDGVISLTVSQMDEVLSFVSQTSTVSFRAKQMIIEGRRLIGQVKSKILKQLG